MANGAEPAGYSTRPFLTIRRGYLDVLDAGRRRRLVHGLVEADVTEVRAALSAADLSFTGHVAWCVARAVVADPIVHAYRQGRRLVLFDDVDINTQIEVDLAGQKIVQSLILRSVNRSDVEQLTRQIRAAASKARPASQRRYRGAAAFFALPGWLRRLPFRAVMANPALFRRFGGTVGLSAVGMFGAGGWAIPLTPTTLMITVGGITRKPRFIEGVLQDRELLGLTLTFDHTVVDGAPAARFASRLIQLISDPGFVPDSGGGGNTS